MNSITISFDFKPLSYNGYYKNSRSGNRIKTGAGLAYDEQLEQLLEGRSNDLSKFGESIDLSKNIVSIDIEYYNPEFLIKDGSRLSKTAGDIDNIVKVLQDKIFKHVKVDDSCVRELTVKSYPSKELLVKVSLDILEIPPIYI